MFTDQVSIKVVAGKGGNGMVSFRKEKFIDRGGPDGGDGGDGGDIMTVASRNLNTLSHFRKGQVIRADNGSDGGKRNRRGKSATDLTIKVPVGTVIISDSNLIADMTDEGQQELLARGGKGGFGNAHFKSSRRQAPRVAEKGEPGESKELELELKLIAQVGLVGLPNAGKSTFLSVVTDAKPKVADYPFTTLTPNLGVSDIGESSILIADIPGLIEGASRGKGLGDAFLRHIERTQVLLHLVDISNSDFVDNYKAVSKELSNYTADLTQKQEIVVAAKSDLVKDKELKARLKTLKKAAQGEVMTISSVKKEGVKELLKKADKLIRQKPKPTEDDSEEDDIPVYELDSADRWEVSKIKDGYRVTGQKIEKFARKTDFGNDHSLQRFFDIMRKMGIYHALVRAGAKPGDEVRVGQDKFRL